MCLDLWLPVGYDGSVTARIDVAGRVPGRGHVSKRAALIPGLALLQGAILNLVHVRVRTLATTRGRQTLLNQKTHNLLLPTKITIIIRRS